MKQQNSGKMGKLWVVFVLCMLAGVIPAFCSIDQSPQAVKEWFKKLPGMKEKVTELHFYFHDSVLGKNPTSFIVAQPNTTSPQPIHFGTILVGDDPLTVGPQPDSEEIGKFQGVLSQAAMDEVKFHLDVNLIFTKGKYNGSTLAITGWNPILDKYRELSIVGGSGYFRLARGIATAQTYSFNATSISAVVEFNIVVIHY